MKCLRKLSLMIKNENKYIDLHIHTKYSDGSLSPTEVVTYASKMGLTAIAITDHDNVDGIDEAMAVGHKCGIEVVPGIEISVDGFGCCKNEIHILAYYIDWKNAEFQEKLYQVRQARRERAYKILSKLHSLGVNIKLEDVFDLVEEGGSVGRLHFAKTMIKNKYVKNTMEAFDKYLGFEKPAYVPKLQWTAKDAIGAILDVGGVPFLAHPLCEKITEEWLKELISFGLVGVEMYHSRHKGRYLGLLKQLINKYNLLCSGGTDCHGSIGDNVPLMGTIKIPCSILDKLKEYKKIDKKKK